MKKLYTLCLALLSATVAFGQATLPEFYDFETTPAVPTGWTTNTSSFYSSGVSGISGKLNGDDQHFTVYFLDEPGDVSYYLKGWVGGSVSSWIGEFSVQESTDGNTWTTVRTFNDGDLDVNSYVQYTDALASSTRYVRWYFTDKQSGANVGIDDVNIALPVAGPQQEINVTYAGNNVPSTTQVAFSSPVSTTTPITLTVENLGTANTLNISSTNITGANAGDFSISSAPSTISAQSDDQLIIDFTPSQAGTRLATLEIGNDDANENPYIVELYGIGGTLATEPSNPAGNLNFTDVKSYRMTVNWNASADAAGYLVLRRTGAAPTSSPTDGMEYDRGDNIGDAKVAYIGDGTAFVPSYFHANTDYHYAIYAYNGFGQYINYLESTPTTGMQATSDNMAGSYYNGIDVNDATFIGDLTTLVNNHSFVWYAEYDETMIRLFTQRDTVDNQRVVTCVYSGEDYVYTEPFTWDDYSREHTFPHSWMPTEPADNPEQPEYNDQHNLFPTRFQEVNSVRLNYPLGNVVNVTSTYVDGTFGTDANGNQVYEPRDEHKGDAARAIFYMCAAYNGVNGNAWNLPSNIGIFVPYGQDQNVLKAWHWADPPSDWEIARNDFLDSLQGNRNPFVDSAHYVCYIDFDDMSKIDNPDFPCTSTPDAIDELGALTTFSLYPNPSEGPVTLQMELSSPEVVTIKVRDLTGKVIYTDQLQGKNGVNILRIQEQLSNGLYLVEIAGNSFISTKEVVIQR